jgi:hypothetical protein
MGSVLHMRNAFISKDFTPPILVTPDDEAIFLRITEDPLVECFATHNSS